MSIYTILIFVALAVAGAIIAYLADITGAWLGKRRSSIFGLRPRQSARIFVAVIGAVLPLLGLLVATIGSDYARLAVFELNDLLKRQDQLQQNIGELQEQLESYEQQVVVAEERAEHAEERAEELVGIQEEQRAHILDLTGRAEQLQTRTGDLQQKVATLNTLRDTLDADLSSARVDLQSAEAALQRSERDLSVTEEQRERLRADVDSLRTRVENRVNQLATVNRELDQIQRHLEPTQRELEARMREVAAKEQQIAEIEERIEDIYRRQELFSEQRALFEPGDELIRVVLSSDDTQDQMEAELFEILHLASAVAERQRVPRGDNGRAVIVVAPVPDWFVGRNVPERMIVRDVATRLRNADADEWVIMVRAFRRYFPGDAVQLAVQFEARENRLCFREGEVIDEFVISSEVTALQAFERLWLRIANQPTSNVRAAATARDMLPHPATGNYGSIELADLFNTAEQISRGSGIMRVRVRAASDTYTRGPLVLNIEVTQDNAPS